MLLLWGALMMGCVRADDDDVDEATMPKRRRYLRTADAAQANNIVSSNGSTSGDDPLMMALNYNNIVASDASAITTTKSGGTGRGGEDDADNLSVQVDEPFVQSSAAAVDGQLDGTTWLFDDSDNDDDNDNSHDDSALLQASILQAMRDEATHFFQVVELDDSEDAADLVAEPLYDSLGW